MANWSDYPERKEIILIVLVLAGLVSNYPWNYNGT